MGHTGKLPKISQFVSDSLSEMGFKAINGRPYEFIGSVKSQTDDYGMAALLTVMPLKLQRDTYVISLEMNGEQMVKSRLAKLDDIANLVGYAGVMKEILSTVDGKEKDASRKTNTRGDKPTDSGSNR